MKRPPLVWLQAFEAAGRTGSFKAAAEELNVSPSNISHQVRDLEAYLGTLLFSRSGRKVELTAEGKHYLPALTDGFTRLRQASVRREPAVDRLHVGAFPFLANEVLTPGLNAVKQRLPDTDLRLFTHTDVAALTHVDPAHRLDVVIRYGRNPPRFPGLSAIHLADVRLLPIVGSAAETPAGPQALLQQPLIRVIGPFQGWERWCASFCPGTQPTDFVLETDSYHAAMLAVERGDGVCLGIEPFISPWVAQGRVAALADYTLPIDDYAAYAVFAPYRQDDPAIHIFVAWLRETLMLGSGSGSGSGSDP